MVLELVNQKNDTSLSKNYTSALIKIKAVLRNQQKEKIELLDSRISADSKYTINPLPINLFIKTKLPNVM